MHIKKKAERAVIPGKNSRNRDKPFAIAGYPSASQTELQPAGEKRRETAPLYPPSSKMVITFVSFGIVIGHNENGVLVMSDGSTGKPLFNITEKSRSSASSVPEATIMKSRQTPSGISPAGRFSSDARARAEKIRPKSRRVRAF
jgi:hypothetical protein